MCRFKLYTRIDTTNDLRATKHTTRYRSPHEITFIHRFFGLGLIFVVKSALHLISSQCIPFIFVCGFSNQLETTENKLTPWIKIKFSFYEARIEKERIYQRDSRLHARLVQCNKRSIIKRQFNLRRCTRLTENGMDRSWRIISIRESQ